LANVVSGQVTEIEKTGRLITDIDVIEVEAAPRDENISIKFGGHETVGLFDHNHGQPDSTMVATLGDSGFVEIEIVGMDLAGMLGIPLGTKVQVEW
jgi:S-adenosylmethionine hydrolase